MIYRNVCDVSVSDRSRLQVNMHNLIPFMKIVYVHRQKQRPGSEGDESKPPVIMIISGEWHWKA